MIGLILNLRTCLVPWAAFSPCLMALGSSGLAAAAVAAEVGVWSGEVDGRYSVNQSRYVTREVSLSADVAYPMAQSELDGEFRFDREFIKIEGTPVEVNTDKYDASLKYKYFLDDLPYYGYLSPRMRHNRFGYYQSSHSLRAGLGRKFSVSTQWELNVELGSGYREAQLLDGPTISETLYTMTVKARWAVNDNTTIKLNLVNERSDRETFRTVSLGVRNKLSERLGLKYELLYSRALPLDSFERGGELTSEVGLSYSF